MKERLFLIIAMMLILACNEEASDEPPQITVDLSPVWAGVWSIDAGKPKHFDLTLRNTGGGTLEIKSAKIKGDQNCAFTKQGPDEKKLTENNEAFVRIFYEPTVRGRDSISLIVNSNSEKYKKFIIPICGMGVLPDELPDETDTDSDTESADDSIDRTCDAPPDDQPDCEADDAEGK